MRIVGINYCDYYGLSPRDFASLIREVGFGATFVEAFSDDGKYAECAKAFSDNGILWETVHAPFNGINDIWLDKDGGEIMLRRLIDTVDNCARYSVPTAVVHLSSGVKCPSVTDTGRARFESLVDHAVKNGVNIAFENQRKLANISWAFETFENVSNVGFCWDVGHEGCFTQGREYMPLFGKKLLCTHIHDNDGMFDHDLHEIPFDGKINFYKVASHIREAGFAGTLMLEIFPGISGIYKSMSSERIISHAYEAVSRLRDMVDRK